MSSLPKFLIFGHSHLEALLDAYSRVEPNDLGFELVPYQFLHPDRSHIVNIDGKWQYHPECLCELQDLINATAPTILVSMLQGEQAILAGLVKPERPFEFYLPDESEAYGDSIEVMPFDMIFECCKEQYSVFSPFLAKLQSSISSPVFALSFPPPIDDPDFILANLHYSLEREQLASASWRYRIWKVHALVLQSIYEESGIPLIPPPPDSFDDNGYLRREFWQDAVHANVQYGHSLLQQLKNLSMEIG